MYKYRLKFLRDHDDGDPDTVTFDKPVSPGEVIHLEETGWYHYVSARHQLKASVRLDLSKSSESESEAELLAEQYGDLTED